MRALIAIRQAWAFIVESFGRTIEPAPARVAAEAPPRRIRVKRGGRSILRHYRPQTWAQACYQFAAEHEGLHVWPMIGRQRVRRAVVEARGADVLLTIELNRASSDRWQGWWFAADGRVYEQWGGAGDGKKDEGKGHTNQQEG